MILCIGQLQPITPYRISLFVCLLFFFLVFFLGGVLFFLLFFVGFFGGALCVCVCVRSVGGRWGAVLVLNVILLIP